MRKHHFVFVSSLAIWNCAPTALFFDPTLKAPCYKRAVYEPLFEGISHRSIGRNESTDKPLTENSSKCL